MRFCERSAQQGSGFLAVAGAEEPADLGAFAAEAQIEASDEVAFLVFLELDLDPVAGEMQFLVLLVMIEALEDELVRGDFDPLFLQRIIVVLAEGPPDESDVGAKKGRDRP